MITIEFQNAVARDTGYGLEVNGKALAEIISTALGTRVGNSYGYHSGLPEFKSTCCDITVIINPKPVTTKIDTEFDYWEGVEELEAFRREQFEQKDAEADPEE